MTYPATAEGLRNGGRSAIHPPASFAKLAMPSETPSMTPSATGGAPMLARNAGNIAVAVSCPQSENRLPSPSPSTPRVSQRFEDLDEDESALSRSLMSTNSQCRCLVDERRKRGNDALRPLVALLRLEPQNGLAQLVERL